MNSSVWFVLILGFFVSCKDVAPPAEPLDPTLVSIAGKQYKDYLREEIKPPESDTIQMLAFDSAHLVFNLNKREKEITHQFDYKNIGDKASYIQLVTSACNCVNEDYKKEILNPGESDKLNITFDPSLWEPGESKTLYVFTKHFPHQVDLIIERNK